MQRLDRRPFSPRARSKHPALCLAFGAINALSVISPWAALAAALSGCMQLAPALPQAQVSLPASFSAPNTDTDTDTAAATLAPAPSETAAPGLPTLAWQDWCQEPVLRGLIQQALDNNRDLRVASARLAQAAAAAGLQRSESFPTVEAVGSFTRLHIPSGLSLTGQPLLANSHSLALAVSNWEIDLWGRLANLHTAATETWLASAAGQRAVQLGLIQQVAASVLTLRELQERQALAAQALATRRESLRIMRRRVEVGSTARMDLAQVETLLTQAEALALELSLSQAREQHALSLLLGQPALLPPATRGLPGGPAASAAPGGEALHREVPNEGSDGVADNAAPAWFAPVQAGLPADLLLQRPDVIAAEHQLKAANARIGAARAAYFPRLALTAEAGTASAELNGLFKSSSQLWALAPSLSLPIFDAGRTGANVDLARARQDEALASYEKTVQTAFREVADALAARAHLDALLAVQQRALAAQTERARLAELRYRNGATLYLEVLDAQRDLLSVQQALVQTRRLALASQVALYAALGAGLGPDSSGDRLSDPATTRRQPAAPAAAAATAPAPGTL